MLDMGFKRDIAKIIEACPPPKTGPDDKEGRQTLMFSATFPKEIQIFAMVSSFSRLLWLFNFVLSCWLEMDVFFYLIFFLE